MDDIEEIVRECLLQRAATDADRETLFAAAASKHGLAYNVLYSAWLHGGPWVDDDGRGI
jgi:hypothetical protein